MKFKNPQNNYTEEFSEYCGVYVFLFGSLYFLVKGVWTHAIVSAILAIFTCGISWLIYPFFAKSIMESYYLRKGWLRIDQSYAYNPPYSHRHK